MSGVPYSMWLAYLKLVWSYCAAQPRSVLDVCCGTGRLSRLLSAEGYRVVGVDLSEGMIAEARRRAAEEGLDIRYEVSDAAEFRLGETFDAAFSFFDSLNYITEPERLRQAFERVAEHLSPGGWFLFDLNTAYAFEKRMFDQKETRRDAPVRYQWKGSWDARTRLCTVTMDFEAEGEQFREVHVQRAHPPQEVERFLFEAGFDRVEVFDAYTLTPPRRRSDRIHVLARRTVENG
jgi:SAM-dependent methyltransferase